MTHLVPFVFNILCKFPVDITLQVKAIQSYLENMIQCTIQSAITCRKDDYDNI